MVAAAQAVKPNGTAKVGFSAKDWLGCQYDLHTFLKAYEDGGDWRNLRTFVSLPGTSNTCMWTNRKVKRA